MRRQMLRGRLGPLVYQAIERRYQSAFWRERIKPFVSSSLNVAKQVVERVVTVYSVSPRRTKGSGPQSDFWKIIEESQLPQIAGDLARQAWFAGPVYVMPVMDLDGSLHLKRWGAGHVSVAYAGYRISAILAVEEVDRSGNPTAYWYADDVMVGRYRQVGSKIETISEYEHGLSRCPVVEWRAHPMEVDDHLGLDYGEALQDATLEAGVVYAGLQYARKAQNYKVPVVKSRKYGPDESHLTQAPAQQTIDPEGGIVLGEDEALDIVDYDLSPANAQQQIAFIVSSALQHYGLELTAPLNVSLQVEISLSSTLAHRNEILRWAAPADAQTCDLIVEVAKAGGHPLADAIEDAPTTVQFPEQALIADPLRREELYALQAARGGTNPVEAYMLDHPGSSYEEAEVAVQKNIELVTAVTSAMSERRAPSPDHMGGSLSTLDMQSIDPQITERN